MRKDRPASPYRKDGTLDPREWMVACSAAGVLNLVVLAGKPWFVTARPVEVLGKGVELEVVVRWLSPEVWAEVPESVDGFTVDVLLEGQENEIQPVH